MFRQVGIAALIVVTPSAVLEAQEPTRTSAIGIGVSLSPLTFSGDFDSPSIIFGQPVILLPIRRGTVVIEPEFALQRSTTSQTGNGFSNDQTINTWRLGVGLLLETGVREQLHPYMGARLGIQRGTVESSSGFGGNFELDLKGSYMAAIAGAQHYFTPRFSLGGEAQLMRASATLDESDANTNEMTSTTVTTLGVVTIRWYF